MVGWIGRAISQISGSVGVSQSPSSEDVAKTLDHQASSVFDRVREMGLCVPNAYTYNCLLEAISKSNSSSVELVEARLKEMRDCGFHFDKFTLTPVLQVYCNTGKSERALSVFNEILFKLPPLIHDSLFFIDELNASIANEIFSITIVRELIDKFS